MSSLEKAFYHHTKDNAGVAALVSGRVYRAGSAPTGDRDYVSYQRLVTGRTRHQGGTSGLADASMQANCYSTSQTTAKAIADAVRAAWEVQKGATGEVGDTINVRVASIENELSDTEIATDGSQVLWHRVVLDITIWYSETARSFS